MELDIYSLKCRLIEVKQEIEDLKVVQIGIEEALIEFFDNEGTNISIRGLR